MKTTPARLLHKGQLLIEHYAVQKVVDVAFPLPQNIVTVKLKNQISGEESSRGLPWESLHTTEEPLEVPIGQTGKIRVELAQLADQEGRPAYRYRVTDESAGIDYEAADLRLDASLRPDNATAAKSLLAFLGATSEAFLVGHALEADAFPEDVNFWSHQKSAEILMAQLGLGEGLER
jgi:hypothetical protein